MFVRYWVIYLLLHLIGKVSLQDPVKISGVVGGSVILKCSYNERELKPEEINVFWRYNQRKNVYDIENGNSSTEEQDAMFKGRIESFPSQYKNGNFTLIFSNLRLTDEGQFLCEIPDVPKKYELTLLVRAPPPTMPSAVSTPKPKENARSSSMRAQAEGIVTFLIVVFCTIL